MYVACDATHTTCWHDHIMICISYVLDFDWGETDRNLPKIYGRSRGWLLLRQARGFERPRGDLFCVLFLSFQVYAITNTSYHCIYTNDSSLMRFFSAVVAILLPYI